MPFHSGWVGLGYCSWHWDLAGANRGEWETHPENDRALAGLGTKRFRRLVVLLSPGSWSWQVSLEQLKRPTHSQEPVQWESAFSCVSRFLKGPCSSILKVQCLTHESLPWLHIPLVWPCTGLIKAAETGGPFNSSLPLGWEATVQFEHKFGGPANWNGIKDFRGLRFVYFWPGPRFPGPLVVGKARGSEWPWPRIRSSPRRNEVQRISNILIVFSETCRGEGGASCLSSPLKPPVQLDFPLLCDNGAYHY